MKKFFKAVIALLLGHFTIFKHIFKKAVTKEYPEVKPILNDRFRGEPVLHKEKCIGCGICQKVCPANAISFKESKIDYIDMNKCILCGNCVTYCKNTAIVLSNKFELATESKENLKKGIND